MGYSSIVWLPICAGVTALGLVLSYYVGRRRGHMSMVRGAAWSLLPLAAYLTGSIEMFWKIGAAIGHYADGFVFSTERWSGVAVAGVAALLFVSTGGKRRRRARRLARKAARGERAAEGPAGTAAIPTARRADTVTAADGSTRTMDLAPAKPAKSGKGRGAAAAGDDDDMKDIDAILRKRGI